MICASRLAMMVILDKTHTLYAAKTLNGKDRFLALVSFSLLEKTTNATIEISFTLVSHSKSVEIIH